MNAVMAVEAAQREVTRLEGELAAARADLRDAEHDEQDAEHALAAGLNGAGRAAGLVGTEYPSHVAMHPERDGEQSFSRVTDSALNDGGHMGVYVDANGPHVSTRTEYHPDYPIAGAGPYTSGWQEVYEVAYLDSIIWFWAPDRLGETRPRWQDNHGHRSDW